MSLSLENFIRAMPKVELHVYLEGSIQPKREEMVRQFKTEFIELRQEFQL